MKSKLAHARKTSWPALAGSKQSRTFAGPIGIMELEIVVSRNGGTLV